MKKRWYNYFVVSDSASPEADIPAESARRVADVVPDADTEPVLPSPVANPTEFAEIYESARITVPAHGYSILKVADMLQSEHIQALPAEVKRKSILVALDAAGVKVGEIVQDAVQRDRAIDAYERVLQRNLEALRAEKEAENQRLETEINERVRELRTRIEQNQKEVDAEKTRLAEWRGKKHQEEERIADAVGYFVSENPVSRSSTISPTTKPTTKGGS